MSHRDRDRREGRRPSTRRPRRRFLVVTEGDVTEPSYLDGLKRFFRNPLVEVVVEGGHGDPSHVVEKAIELRDKATRRARKEHDRFLKYDEVWSVVDVDDHPRLNEACDRARTNEVRIAVSSPSFELWLLLHVREHSPGCHDRSRIRSMLQENWADYDKEVDFSRCEQGYYSAVILARRLYAEARDAGEPNRNPSTAFYRLAELIRIESMPTSTSDEIALRRAALREYRADMEW